VLLVDGVEEALGLVAEVERPPDIGNPIGAVELALAPAGALAQARKQAHATRHDAQISARAATLSGQSGRVPVVLPSLPLLVRRQEKLGRKLRGNRYRQMVQRCQGIRL